MENVKKGDILDGLFQIKNDDTSYNGKSMQI